jgi:hypothetical protein
LFIALLLWDIIVGFGALCGEVAFVITEMERDNECGGFIPIKALDKELDSATFVLWPL